MEQEKFIELYNFLDWLFFIILGISTIYLLVYAIASRFFKTPVFETPTTSKRFLVLIPAYKEDEIIIETAKALACQSYPEDAREFVVIADRMYASTNKQLMEMGFTVLIYEPYNSLKAKALQFAMSHYEKESFDVVVVLDADNIVEQTFLQQLNKAFNAGLKAVQAHRMAKKAKNDIAVLDGISEEINNALFRKGHAALGISSALIGSGMAFTFDWFKQVIGQLTTSGEDKELELFLLQDKINVYYLDDVVVLDEKVTRSKTFFNQRRRWLASQLYIFGKAIRKLPTAILSLQIDYIDKVIQWMMPPRVVLLGTVAILSILALFIDLTVAIKWWVLLALCLIWLILSIPPSMMKKITLSSLLRLPVLFVLMGINIFRTKGAVNTFIHTKKKGNSDTNFDEESQ
jgi:cellulose synthase/poly-beta-1,6-N-acetylglucosamine synthase-like glycosyltransferase